MARLSSTQNVNFSADFQNMARVLTVRVSNAGRRFTDFVRKYLSRESGALYRTRLLANCAASRRVRHRGQ